MLIFAPGSLRQQVGAAIGLLNTYLIKIIHVPWIMNSLILKIQNIFLQITYYEYYYPEFKEKYDCEMFWETLFKIFVCKSILMVKLYLKNQFQGLKIINESLNFIRKTIILNFYYTN